MDRLVENSIGLMCHWARIVPAAGVYASTTMLAFRLQGADEGLHIASVLRGRSCLSFDTMMFRAWELTEHKVRG
jgi:hypothetical protein